MKIQREIAGQVVEFELTSEELYGAYLEKEHEYDCQDIQDELESYNFNDETRKDFFDIYGIPLDKVLGNDELIDELAYEKRHNQDHYGMNWDSARDEAFRDILSVRKLEIKGLPEMCYSVLPSSGEVVIIKRGKAGYYETSYENISAEFNRDLADEANRKLGVSKAQASAMQAGSLFGWDAPAADPAIYDENGALKAVESETSITITDSLKDAVAIEYRGIVFDEWTADDDGGVWGEMCQCCAEKYKDVLSDELSEGGIGACSVKDCDVVGDLIDTNTHYYIDFKPELIRPLSREQLQALQQDNSLAAKIQAAQVQVNDDKSENILRDCER